MFLEYNVLYLARYTQAILNSSHSSSFPSYLMYTSVFRNKHVFDYPQEDVDES